MYLLLGLYAGMLPAAIGQLQGRFSDEEFFVAIQASAVGLLWLLLRLPYRELGRGQADAAAQMRGAAISLRSIAAGLVLVGGAAGLIPSTAISAASTHRALPCMIRSLRKRPSCAARLHRANRVGRRWGSHHQPSAGGGGRTIRTREPLSMACWHWGQGRNVGLRPSGKACCRRRLPNGLARQRTASSPSSMKLRMRAYYLPRVRQVFPRLFSEAELLVLTDWFAAINRRALTVEWVDWMYAVALARWPSGPYENQESGAGLLSILITGGLEDPALADANRSYLEQNPRGWLARFRNTDDAFIYQPEWLTNALFQAGYTGQIGRPQPRASFEWLLMQALPDGRRLNTITLAALQSLGLPIWQRWSSAIRVISG